MYAVERFLVPAPTVPVPNLHSYDVVLINVSGGKDSIAMLVYLVLLAVKQGFPLERLLVVHADLGSVEWDGNLELVREHAERVGLRLVVVAAGRDLLDEVVARRQRLLAQGRPEVRPWPSALARSCTKSLKTQPVTKLMTHLAAEHRKVHGRTAQIRILNCLGIRAQESPARALQRPFGPDPATWTVSPRAARPATRTRPAVEERAGVPNGRRVVHRWLPIFDWSLEQVWAMVDASGLRVPQAYRLGSSRYSCPFCVLASRKDLVIAARHNRELARRYLAVERQVGHPFRLDMSIADVIAVSAETARGNARISASRSAASRARFSAAA
jgi:3'-phosphoadenosine 5'-phosphosulfate sulfotransferase (PAPS reductase)/FAD synthetase